MTSDTYKDLNLILSEKQKIIDKLSDEKNSLLKVISHDIKAPFNQLYALLQLFELEVEDLGGRPKEYIDKMYHAIISGMEMIQNLTDLRSIDQKNLTVQKDKLDIEKVLKKALSHYQIQMRLKNIQVDLTNEDQSITIYSDEMLLIKILDKILSNAVKYSENNTTIHIHYVKIQDIVNITILDEGPGLSEDEISLIYEPFRTLCVKPTFGGGTTGLGMYLASKFSEMLGIKIVVERKKPKGLMVSLSLPVR